MILIVVKFPVKPEHADAWPQIAREFTEATRAEPGNKWFDWSRSVDDPNEYVLVEAFRDDAAEAHGEVLGGEQRRAHAAGATGRCARLPRGRRRPSRSCARATSCEGCGTSSRRGKRSASPKTCAP